MFENLLELDKVTKIFPVRGALFKTKKILKAVDNVTLKIPPRVDKPCIFSLVGESGSGKTTIARLILKFIKPTSGEIRYKGKNINNYDFPERTYRKEVQAVFQDPYGSYNPFYKVNHILEITIKKFQLASSSTEIRQIMVESLRGVGLQPEEVLGKYPHELSGGQLQRVMVARALITNPKLLIADEPVSMIDASLRANILNLLLKAKSNGTSILFITHDLAVAYYLSDYIVILYSGKIVEKGEAEVIIKNPAHPYSQLLIESIPVPNPKKRWSIEEDLLDKAKLTPHSSSVVTGCPFCYRCPHAMEKCAEKSPPLIPLDKEHEVLCYLYD